MITVISPTGRERAYTEATTVTVTGAGHLEVWQLAGSRRRRLAVWASGAWACFEGPEVFDGLEATGPGGSVVDLAGQSEHEGAQDLTGAASAAT